MQFQYLISFLCTFFDFKPLLANTWRSPFRPRLSVGSSKCSHERPWLGEPADPRSQGKTVRSASSTRATTRPETLLHGQRTATCRQMLHGHVVQIHLLHFLVAGFVQKAEQVQHAVRGGTVRLQGSQRICQSGRPICCPLDQLHTPKIQGSVQEVFQCWNLNRVVFHVPQTRLLATPSWGDSVFLKCQEIPFTQLTALYAQEIIVEPSWKKLHAVYTCQWHLLMKPKGKKVPKVKFRRNMRNDEKCVKALPESIR